MSIFKPAENTTAFAKVGILGFAGSGKTRTATEIAIGLHKALKSTKPVAFLDTETGSDFTIPFFKKEGIELIVSKTRAFKDLAEGMREAPKVSDILIIDSVSHYWTDIVESYKKKKNVTRLSFQDWGVLKPMWNDDFSTPFVTSKIHIIVCGRAGFEYDYFEGDDGKMELYKTGTKMKTEGEFGFEPSLMIEMQRIKNPEATEDYKTAKSKNERMKAAARINAEREFVRVATILKDRSDIMDGMRFSNPTYADFAPHWKSLNIGGEHHPVDKGDSQDLFNIEGKPDWKVRKEQAVITLEEIEGLMVKTFPGSSTKEKKAKIDLIEQIFHKRSWTYVQSLSLESLKDGLDRMNSLLSRPNNVLILLGDAPGPFELEDIPDLPPPEKTTPQGAQDEKPATTRPTTDELTCSRDGEPRTVGWCRDSCMENIDCQDWR